MINLLRDLQRRLGLAYIFISHDLAVVKHIADRIAVMHLGRIVEIGPSQALFTNPRHPYSRALLSAIPVPDAGRQARTHHPARRDAERIASARGLRVPYPMPIRRRALLRPNDPNSSVVRTRPPVTVPTSCRRRPTSFPHQGRLPPALERLVDAFRHRADRQGGAGVATVETTGGKDLSTARMP